MRPVQMWLFFYYLREGGREGKVFEYTEETIESTFSVKKVCVCLCLYTK